MTLSPVGPESDSTTGLEVPVPKLRREKPVVLALGSGRSDVVVVDGWRVESSDPLALVSLACDISSSFSFFVDLKIFRT
jgi:hypothetical protein